jgi:hypothetical protein
MLPLCASFIREREGQREGQRKSENKQTSLLCFFKEGRREREREKKKKKKKKKKGERR